MADDWMTPGRWALLVALAAALGCLAGCGPSEPKVYPVQGKVVFKDQGGDAHQLRGSYVRMELISDPKVTAVAEIEDEGMFILGSSIDGRPYSGLLEGTYRVRIDPPDPNRKRVIPGRYEQFSTSNLERTIERGGGEILIEVERAGR